MKKWFGLTFQTFILTLPLEVKWLLYLTVLFTNFVIMY